MNDDEKQRYAAQINARVDTIDGRDGATISELLDGIVRASVYQDHELVEMRADRIMKALASVAETCNHVRQGIDDLAGYRPKQDGGDHG